MGEESRPSFFVMDGESFVPQPIAVGPWGATMRGRLLGGLAARAVDEYIGTAPAPGGAKFRCSRLTVEMFRPPKMAPLRTAPVRIIRDGNRIRVLEIVVLQDDVAVGEGRAVLLRTGDQPGGPFRPPPPWQALTPWNGLELRTGSPRHPSSWDAWSLSGNEFMGDGLWVRERHDLVEGEPLSPLVRCSLTADLASPVSNDVQGSRLSFINADYTLYLGRYPRGEELGVQPYGQISDDGLAVGMCILHDGEGPIGYIGITAIANDGDRARAGKAGGHGGVAGGGSTPG